MTPKEINNLKAKARRLVRNHAQAAVNEAFKGCGRPEDYEELEESLLRTRRVLLKFIYGVIDA